MGRFSTVRFLFLSFSSFLRLLDLEELVPTHPLLRRTLRAVIRSEYGFATSSSLKPPAELGEKLKAAAARE